MSHAPRTLPRRHFLALGGVAAGATLLAAEPASASSGESSDSSGTSNGSDRYAHVSPAAPATAEPMITVCRSASPSTG